MSAMLLFLAQSSVHFPSASVIVLFHDIAIASLFENPLLPLDVLSSHGKYPLVPIPALNGQAELCLVGKARRVVVVREIEDQCS